MLTLARSITAALALMSASVFAQQDCDYEGSQREMNACAINDYQQVFATYASAYQDRWRKLPEANRKKFVQESTYWAGTVRKQCIRASRDTGGDETILFYTCLQQVIEFRTMRIKNE